MALHHAVARNEITKEENLVSPFCNLAWLVCLAQLRCPGRHYQVSGAKRFFSLRLPRWWSPSHDNQLWTKKQNLLGLSFSLSALGSNQRGIYLSGSNTAQEVVCYLARSTPRDFPSYFLASCARKIMRLERSFPPSVTTKGDNLVLHWSIFRSWFYIGDWINNFGEARLAILGNNQSNAAGKLFGLLFTAWRGVHKI